MARGVSAEGWVIGGLLVAAVALTVLAAIGIVEDARQWRVYAAANHCKPVGMSRGSISTGVGVSGNGQVAIVPVVESDKTIYRCNNDAIHIR